MLKRGEMLTSDLHHIAAKRKRIPEIPVIRISAACEISGQQIEVSNERDNGELRIRGEENKSA